MKAAPHRTLRQAQRDTLLKCRISRMSCTKATLLLLHRAIMSHVVIIWRRRLVPLHSIKGHHQHITAKMCSPHRRTWPMRYSIAKQIYRRIQTKRCTRIAWAQRQPFNAKVFPIYTIKPFTTNRLIARATVPCIARAKMCIRSHTTLLADRPQQAAQLVRILRRLRSHAAAIALRKSLNKTIYIWAENSMGNPNQKATAISLVVISITPSTAPPSDDRINQVSQLAMEMSAPAFIVGNTRWYTMRHVRPHTSRKPRSNIRETQNLINSISQRCNRIHKIPMQNLKCQRQRRSNLYIYQTLFYIYSQQKYFIQTKIY